MMCIRVVFVVGILIFLVLAAPDTFSFEFPNLVNLEKLFNIKMLTRRLIVITNFQQVNFYGHEYPVVLKERAEMRKSNLVSCPGVDVFKLSVTSKPWISTAHILLLPKNIKSFVYCTTRVFKYPNDEASYFLSPSGISGIRILISLPNSDKQHTDLLTKWLIFEDKGKRISHDILLNINILWRNFSITTTKLIMPYFENDDVKLESIIKARITYNDIVSLYETRYSQFVWLGFWLGSYGVVGKNSPVSKMSNFLNSCKNNDEKSWRLAMSQSKTYEDKFSYAMSVLLLNVMVNKTYQIHSSFKSVCRNGVIFKHEDPFYGNRFGDHNSVYIDFHTVPKEVVHHRHHLYVANHLNELRFVACGKIGFSPYRFAELHNVYDIWIWIYAGVSIVVLGLSICWIVYPSKISSNTSIKIQCKDVYLYILKVLIEQGDPIPGHIAKIKLLRCVLACLLLPGIVLSNAYKNNNVYNMITSRRPLLYKTLEQLVNDNFTIFSQTSEFRLFIGLLTSTTGPIPPLKIEKHFVESKLGNRFSFLLSNVFLDTEVFSRQTLLQLYHGDSKETEILQNVTSASSIHRLVAHHVQSLIDTLITLKRLSLIPNDKLRSDSFLNTLRQLFFEREESWSINDLRACNKTAFILTNDKVPHYTKQIRLKTQADISVGEETYGKVSYGLQFMYWGSSKILDRVKFLRESGIVSWLPKVSANVPINREDTNSPPESASLSGNIFVIFIILLCGYLTSAFSFTYELVNKWWNTIVEKLHGLLSNLTEIFHWIVIYVRHAAANYAKVTLKVIRQTLSRKKQKLTTEFVNVKSKHSNK